MSVEWGELVVKRTNTEFRILLTARKAFKYKDSHIINSRVTTPETKKTSEIET
jgi:hypothetical protein